jgi:hypothetical protein
MYKNPVSHIIQPRQAVAAPPAVKAAGRRWRGLFVAIVAVVLVAAILITGFWQPGFFKGGYTYAGPSYAGNSHAFSITPFPELTVSAEKNALDQDREFAVTKPSEDVFDTLSTEMEASGSVLTNLYEVDAGLEDGQSFPGTFTTTFDLSKMKIPENMYDALTVYRIGDSGEVTELQCDVQSGRLVCRSNKNCFFALAIPVVMGIGVFSTFFGGTIAYTESSEKWEGIDTGNMITTSACNGLYNVSWPANVGSVSAVLQQQDARMKEIIRNIRDAVDFAATTSTNENSGFYSAEERNFQILEAIAANEEYQTIRKQVRDPQWLTDNAAPPEVKKAIDAVTTAHTYLAQTRGITPCPNKTDVILVYNWPSGSTLGISTNPYLGAPYMRINMSNLQNAPASDLDDLLLTITHEMFHVFQANYTTVDWKSDSVFWEATAVTLEGESREYYHDKGIISTMPALTDSNYFETLSVTLGVVPGSDDEILHNGYTLSRLINYLQTTRGFSFDIKELLEAYKTCRDFTASLQMVTKANDADFGQMYRDFCVANTKEFFERYTAVSGNTSLTTLIPAVQLSKTNPVAKVTVQNKPLSAYIREFKVDSAAFGGQYALLLVPDVLLTMHKPGFSTVNITQGVKSTSKGMFFPVQSNPSSYLFEIHKYLFPDNADISTIYKAYLFMPPENPTVKIEEQRRMVITLPPASTAAEAGVVDGYLVTVTSSDGVVTKKHVPYRNWGQPLTLSLSKLTGLKANATFTVSASEYIKDGFQYYYGPVSRDSGTGINEDILDQQLINAQAGKGEITVSMLWSTNDDLDLHIITPSGAEIYYSNESADGGTLDVDRQASEYELVASPIENIFFAAPTEGSYKVFIVNYKDRTEGGASSYLVRVTVGGQSQTFSGSLDGTDNSVNILDFYYGTSTAED